MTLPLHTFALMIGMDERLARQLSATGCNRASRHDHTRSRSWTSPELFAEDHDRRERHHDDQRLLVLTVVLVPAAWNFRKSYKKISELLDRSTATSVR